VTVTDEVGGDGMGWDAGTATSNKTTQHNSQFEIRTLGGVA